LLLSYISVSQGKLSFSDFVGIGTSNPPYKLTLQGAETTGSPDRRTFLSLNNTTQSTASVVNLQLKAGSSNSVTLLTQASSIYGTDFYGNEYADYGQLWSTGTGLILRAGGQISNDGIIKFQTGYAYQGSSNERMRITGNGNVGIGTNNPSVKLAIQGTGDENAGGGSDGRTFLTLNNTTQSDASLVNIQLKTGTSGSSTLLTHTSSIYGTSYYGSEYADFGQLWGTGAGLILRAGGNTFNNGVIKFQTGLATLGSSNERMRISGNGNVGIGTKNPAVKLQVTSGDIYVEDPNRGIILRSPSGNCFRVTIDDSGNFVRTAITCP
jgi:acetolactate synthase regulatory subunit